MKPILFYIPNSIWKFKFKNVLLLSNLSVLKSQRMCKNHINHESCCCSSSLNESDDRKLIKMFRFYTSTRTKETQLLH